MISVVIPVKDAGADLRCCLDALASQVIDDEIEIVVVDSGSRDDSVAVAQAAGARVHRIAPHEFNHGATRNLGASLAGGDVIVFTTQDASATDEHCLARLVAPLRDERVAGTYGRQIARAEARPPERYFIEFLYGPEPRTQRAERRADLSMATTLFSNVWSAIRRETFERFPFVDDVIMSEDQEWSRRVLLAGYEVRYVPAAAVRHSHPYSLRQAFRRFFDSGVSAERAYLYGGRASHATLRRAAARYALGELTWLWRTGQAHWIPYAIVYEAGKFAGLQCGRHWRRLPRPLVRRLSAVPSYWS